MEGGWEEDGRRMEGGWLRTCQFSGFPHSVHTTWPTLRITHIAQHLPHDLAPPLSLSNVLAELVYVDVLAVVRIEFPPQCRPLRRGVQIKVLLHVFMLAHGSHEGTQVDVPVSCVCVMRVSCVCHVRGWVSGFSAGTMHTHRSIVDTSVLRTVPRFSV